jgi:hypothetical protein
MLRVLQLMGETPFFPAGFSGCRPPVLRQQSYRWKPAGLKSRLKKIKSLFEKRAWHFRIGLGLGF